MDNNTKTDSHMIDVFDAGVFIFFWCTMPEAIHESRKSWKTFGYVFLGYLELSFNALGVKNFKIKGTVKEE